MDLEEERQEVRDEVYLVGHWCVLGMECGEKVGTSKRLMPRRVPPSLGSSAWRALDICKQPAVGTKYRAHQNVQEGHRNGNNKPHRQAHRRCGASVALTSRWPCSG